MSYGSKLGITRLSEWHILSSAARLSWRTSLPKRWLGAHRATYIYASADLAWDLTRLSLP